MTNKTEEVDTTVIGATISAELNEQIKAIAEEENRSVSNCIAGLLKEAVTARIEEE